MDRLIFLSMAAAKNVELQQATTAQNLANTHTNAYKADRVAFRALPVVGPGAPTRTYVVDNTIGHDLSQGALQQTGNERDFALATPGFLAVQTPDGKEAYTRDGGFIVDRTGTLRTRTGLLILSQQGGAITVPLDQGVQLGSDGTVYSVPLTGDNITLDTVGQMKLVNPAPKEVYKGQDGLFHTNPAVRTPLLPDPNVVIQTGVLEASNVNIVESLVQMISHGRAFDFNAKMMQSIDQNEQRATQLLSVGA